jgi:putative aldouronate transport system permease protein
MYGFVLSDSRIYLAYFNTILYVVTGTILSLGMTAAGAYAASREAMVFRKLYIKLMIICMFFSGGMIPTYLVVRKLGILDTIWAIILPGAISMWLFMVALTFFRTLPPELEDAAKIDGMGDIGVFWYVAVPLSKAALATIGLFYAVGIWNDYMGPLLYLNRPNKFPLTVILRDMIIAGEDMGDRGRSMEKGGLVAVDSMKFATLMVSILPIMCLYPFLQKYFIKGALVGSLKG